MGGVVNSAVLVLNENYEPLNVCSARRAVVLIGRGKAEVLERDEITVLRTPSHVIPLPSVIRLVYLIRRPRPQRKLTRRELFLRDRYRCQYCGRESKDLTVDHVMPRQRGGKHIWENLVSACKQCNHRKAARTPEEARMMLLSQPEVPKTSSYHIVYQYIHSHVEWQKFIPARELALIL